MFTPPTVTHYIDRSEISTLQGFCFKILFPGINFEQCFLLRPYVIMAVYTSNEAGYNKQGHGAPSTVLNATFKPQQCQKIGLLKYSPLVLDSGISKCCSSQECLTLTVPDAEGCSACPLCSIQRLYHTGRGRKHPASMMRDKMPKCPHHTWMSIRHEEESPAMQTAQAPYIALIIYQHPQKVLPPLVP